MDDARLEGRRGLEGWVRGLWAAVGACTCSCWLLTAGGCPLPAAATAVAMAMAEAGVEGGAGVRAGGEAVLGAWGGLAARTGAAILAWVGAGVRARFRAGAWRVTGAEGEAAAACLKGAGFLCQAELGYLGFAAPSRCWGSCCVASARAGWTKSAARGAQAILPRRKGMSMEGSRCNVNR